MNKQKKIVIFLIILFLGFIFYWFQIRPSQIRQRCHKWIVDLPGSIEKELSEKGIKAYDALYNRCLHEKGLK